MTSVPLTDIVRETIAELEPQAHAHRIQPFLDSPPTPCLLETDRAKLKRILSNLVPMR